MNDTFDLLRFIEAQQPVYDRALHELRAGRKATHWMWFVFPQLRGLGRSEMAERFGLSGAAEAQGYLQHPVLGPRLLESVTTLLQHRDKSALDILGHPDDLKLRSCLTLFAAIAPDEAVFQEALERFFGGEMDARTVLLLGE
jgi:uncharacterized protein (DUF1810 family)